MTRELVDGEVKEKVEEGLFEDSKYMENPESITHWLKKMFTHLNKLMALSRPFLTTAPLNLPPFLRPTLI